MAKVKRNKRRNPVANSPLLRKGGVHEKSRSGERQQGKQQLKQLISPYPLPWILYSRREKPCTSK